VHGLIHHLTVAEQPADNEGNSGKYEVAKKREFLPQIFAALVVKIIPALRRKTDSTREKWRVLLLAIL
jgi:hypothetical protein